MYARLPKPQAQTDVSLTDAVYSGLKAEAAAVTERLLESRDAMQLVNEMLIPALDRVGEDFEKNKIFLPQLIQSANTAQACFDVIKRHLSQSGGASVSKAMRMRSCLAGKLRGISVFLQGAIC